MRRGVITGAGLVALWQVLVWVLGLPAFVLPAPVAVVRALVVDWRLLADHGLTTLIEVVAGLGLGVGLGVGLALGLQLAPAARRSLLLAGGIGVTPILSMAEHLSASGAAFAMHYCTRSAERTAFRARIAASAYAPHVQHHFDDGDAAQKLDLLALLAKPQAGLHLYVCGPKGFMDAVLGTARAQGWPEAQLHFEFFAAEVVHSAQDGSFEVKLASSGRIIPVA